LACYEIGQGRDSLASIGAKCNIRVRVNDLVVNPPLVHVRSALLEHFMVRFRFKNPERGETSFFDVHNDFSVDGRGPAFDIRILAQR
jgi:hypothetical protein